MNRELFKAKVLNDIYRQILPVDVTINTMTVICDTNIQFNIKNILLTSNRMMILNGMMLLTLKIPDILITEINLMGYL